jgi:hypothetical protein
MSSREQQFDALITRLLEPHPDLDYYSLTLLGDEGGNLIWSCYSGWTGWADVERHIELREASLVQAGPMARLQVALGESCLCANDLPDMGICMILGGNLLMEKNLAECLLPEFLSPQPCVTVGARGFLSTKLLPDGAFNKVPTPKRRMQVLKRDDYRCCVCGRRAADHLDVELHVHHIRPWAEGGVTDERNLITLCHTCHKGLAPHSVPGLYDLIAPSRADSDPSERATEYWQGVARYREKIMQRFSWKIGRDCVQ